MMTPSNKRFTNRATRSVLEIRSPHFYAGPSQARAVRKRSGFVFTIYYIITECKGRTRKYKPKVFHTARACEGCLENQGLVFPGTARAPS